jgi:hypothetical protein
MKSINDKVGEPDNSDLRKFLTDLDVPENLIDFYVTSFSKIGVFDKMDLFSHANVVNLEEIGIANSDIMKIMRQLFASDLPEEEAAPDLPDEVAALEGTKKEIFSDSNKNEADTIFSEFSKNEVIILTEIGHGQSGRISMALYPPSLTLLAVKCIRIESPAHRIVVGHELKKMYKVAHCTSAGPIAGPIGSSSKGTSQASQSLKKEIPSSKETPLVATTVIEVANNPYIINLYDAYIDPQHGAVCLLLEFMNCGSIQSMLNDGLIFDEDDAAVLAFSVLSALTSLHDKDILHGDIKPSNILTNTAGHIKLTDFAIMKGT